MILGATVTLLGAGLALTALLSNDEDEDGPHASEAEADDDTRAFRERSVSVLGSDDVIETDDTTAQIFVATQPRGADGAMPTIRNFDAASDLVASNVSELPASCVREDGTPYFPDTATVAYTLSAEPDETSGATISLQLFDTQNPNTEPICYGVRLEGIRGA